MNSRGRQPAESGNNTLAPAGVEPFPTLQTVRCPHGYSCWAASRPRVGGRVKMLTIRNSAEENPLHQQHVGV